MNRKLWGVGPLSAVTLIGCGQIEEHVVGLAPSLGAVTTVIAAEHSSTAGDSSEQTPTSEDLDEVTVASDAGEASTAGAGCEPSVTAAQVLWTGATERTATCVFGPCTGFLSWMKSDGVGGVWLLYTYVDTVAQHQASLGLLHYAADGAVLSDVLFAEEEVAESSTRRFEARLSLNADGKPVVVAKVTVLDRDEDHVPELGGVKAYFFDGTGEVSHTVALASDEFSVIAEPIVIDDEVMGVVLENVSTVQVVTFDSEQVLDEHEWPEGSYSNIGLRGTSSPASFGGIVGHNNEENVDFFLTRVSTDGQVLWSAPTTDGNRYNVTMAPSGELVTTTLGGPGWVVRGYDEGQESWSVAVPFPWASDISMQNGSYVVPRVGGGFTMKGAWQVEAQLPAVAGVVQLSPDREVCTFSTIEGGGYIQQIESATANEVFVMDGDGDSYRFMKVAL